MSKAACHVVITGGTGFVGRRLAAAILADGKVSEGGPAVERVTLFDQQIPNPMPAELGAFAGDSRLRFMAGDISDPVAIDALMTGQHMVVFHLASVVSGGGEKDFDLALRVNLDGGRVLMEALRKLPGEARPVLVFSSSIAVFGGSAMPDIVGDMTKQTATTTYGVTKTICELLVNDYTRKGFIDGRSARLPTVIVRPGRPNAAASSFVSGLFREPLSGIDMTLPVDLATRMPVIGYRTVVECLRRLATIPSHEIGDDRGIGLPSLDVTVGEMVDALGRVAGNRHLGRIEVVPDAFIQNICDGWPKAIAHERADALKLPADGSVDDIVSAYIEDYL